MNQSDMILEFIDGTLESGDEQSLFDDMAQHPELRAELRQYVMIGDAVRADREAYAPPAEVERRLLGGLGLFPMAQAGGAAAGTAAAASVGTASSTTSALGWLAFANVKTALLPMVVGLLVGVVVGGGGVYLAVHDSSGQDATIASSDRGNAVGSNQTRLPDRSATGAVSASTIPGASNASTAAGTSPGQGAKNVAGGTQTSEIKAKSGKANGAGQMFVSRSSRRQGGDRSKETSSGVAKSAPSLRTPPETPPLESDDKGSPNVMDSLESSGMSPKAAPLIDSDRLLPDEQKAHKSSAVLSQPSPTAFEGSGEAHVFALELRKGFVSQPFADNRARKVQEDFLGEDIVVGAYYSPDPVWYLGLEAGRERFAQSLFYNRAETLFVEQRPAIGWGGVAFGRKMEVLDLPLFLQGTLGASQYGGPMMRGRIGFDLTELFGRNAPSAFSLPISFEASSLVYTYNGQYLVTGNWGISGGVRLRFGF